MTKEQMQPKGAAETQGEPPQSLGDTANVVFAGGGGRCVWQLGFWNVVAPALGLAPECFAAVSAGAAMATCLLADCEDAAMEAFSTRMATNAKNFYPEKLFAPGQRAFPQSDIYRSAMLEAIDDAAWTRFQQAPPLYVLLAAAPWYLGPRSGALLGLACYRTEKALTHPLHPNWGKRMGFSPWVVKAQDCTSREALVELIMQSSCTPPFTPLYRRDGYPVLDGGLIDNVPVDALPDERQALPTLVLLSRPYPPKVDMNHAHRFYVQPSRKAYVSTWDYTSPEKVQMTYDLGRQDGEAFVQQLPRTRQEAPNV